MITTAAKFKLGNFLVHKLRKIMKGDYLVRIIGYQNNILIPLSKVYSTYNTLHIEDETNKMYCYI